MDCPPERTTPPEGTGCGRNVRTRFFRQDRLNTFSKDFAESPDGLPRGVSLVDYSMYTSYETLVHLNKERRRHCISPVKF